MHPTEEIAMSYWLIKTEPETWSWEQQVAKGKKGEPWNGVRNFQARNHMKAMKKGDLCFFYHSGSERAVVGIAEVSREAYPDPTAEAGSPWICVDVIAVEPVKTPVTLAAAKAEPALADMVLVKNSRLSVQPVTPSEWKRVREMGGL
jgi:predicted RNA-binding protein with PUA-like domain